MSTRSSIVLFASECASRSSGAQLEGFMQCFDPQSRACFSENWVSQTKHFCAVSMGLTCTGGGWAEGWLFT
eukprot:2035940-Rhodomonas_salina.4